MAILKLRFILLNNFKDIRETVNILGETPRYIVENYGTVLADN